jgi:hypothetical protein
VEHPPDGRRNLDIVLPRLDPSEDYNSDMNCFDRMQALSVDRHLVAVFDMQDFGQHYSEGVHKFHWALELIQPGLRDCSYVPVEAVEDLQGLAAHHT